MAYYRRRAAGAAAHRDRGRQRPRQRLALRAGPAGRRCGDGWAEIVAALPRRTARWSSPRSATPAARARRRTASVPLWAPSRVPEVDTREVPKWMEADDIAAVVAGFGAAARSPPTPAATASRSTPASTAWSASSCRASPTTVTTRGARIGCASPVDVLAAVRGPSGDAVVGPAPVVRRAGAVGRHHPRQAPGDRRRTGRAGVDYLVVVRGSIYSAEQTRPDFHEPTEFNVELCRAVRSAVPARVAGLPPGLGRRVGPGRVGRRRRRLRRRRDDPGPDRRSRPGAKLAPAAPTDPAVHPLQPDVPGARRPQPHRDLRGRAVQRPRDRRPRLVRAGATARDVVVVGGGPAGLECARVAATRGHRVALVERATDVGGVAAVAGPGGALVAWLEAECARLGVEVTTARRTPSPPGACRRAVHRLATGRGASTTIATDAVVLDVRRRPARAPTPPPTGRCVVLDPVGGPIARRLGRGARRPRRARHAGPHRRQRAVPHRRSRPGQRPPAAARRAHRTTHAPASPSRPGEVEVEDRFTGARRTIPPPRVVDCGFRLPDDAVAGADLAGRRLRRPPHDPRGGARGSPGGPRGGLDPLTSG